MNPSTVLDPEFLRYLVATTNEQSDSPRWSQRAGREAEEGNGSDGNFGGHRRSIDVLPDPAAYLRGVEAVKSETIKWIANIDRPTTAHDDFSLENTRDARFLGDCLDDDQFAALLGDAIAISDRFIPEPRFARDGVGFMHSAGAAALK